jgi:SNF2 family DNA or RNA helicase
MISFFLVAHTVLIIVPINVVQNWVAEFDHWLPAGAEATADADGFGIRPRNFGLNVINDSVKSVEKRNEVRQSDSFY